MKNELKTQRNKDLLDCLHRVKSEKNINMQYISRDALIDILMQQPAPRFYLAERTAEHLVMRYFKGKPTPRPQQTQDLVDVFCEVRAKYPYIPMADIWFYVVNHPAKSFYCSPQRIREIIFNFRKICN